MKVIDDIQGAKALKDRAVVTIGVFDDLHIGHLKLSDRIMTAGKAQNLKTVLVTFDPYPRETLDGKSDSERLLTREEKIGIVSKCGVDAMAFVRFTKKLSELPAAEFIETLLIEKLNMKHMVIGEDLTIGKNREGNASFIGKMALERDFRLQVVPLVKAGKTPVKSSYIRNLLWRGNVRRANKLTDRYYRITGKVVSGKGRGRKLGFKTANMKISGKLIPRNGIYATSSTISSNKYPSATYIGVRPTFGETSFSVETFIIGLNKNIYGRNLSVEFLDFIRPDRKFRNSKALSERISLDVEKARNIFEQTYL
jgi:riboflavin kinase/FMN adenylyltransferase